MITEQDRIRWRYNCKDIIYTREIALAQIPEIKSRSPKLQEFYHFQQHESAPALVNVMNRGVRIDLEKKEELNKQLTKLLIEVEEKINYLVGEPFNPKSLPQIKAVLKDLCGIKPKINKKTKTESFASAYMLEYLKEYPMYSALITLILEYRSIGVFLRTFVSAKVDEDGRMRTAYNIAGTKTYRLSSRKNAFGNGANLANIPSKGKIDLKYSLASIEHSEDTDDNDDIILADEYEGITKLPNCKEFFIPDEGYTFFNADYSGADAMIVAADANCSWLLKFFEAPTLKLYQFVASHYYQREITTDEKAYKVFKQFIHGCVTGDHEVLTPKGWIKFKNLEENVSVLIYDKGSLSFEVPSKLTKDLFEGELITLNGKLAIEGTPNHRQLVWDTRTNTYKEYTLDTLPLSSNLRLINNGIYKEGKLEKEDAFIQLLIAAQADGSWKNFKSARLGFRLKKARKIERILEIFTKLGIEYKQKEFADAQYLECIAPDEIKFYLNELKDFNLEELLKLSYKNLITFSNELQYWDGYSNRGISTSYSTISYNNAIAVQTIGTLTGFQVTLAEQDVKGKKRLFRLTLASSEGNTTRQHTKLIKKYKDYVYCVTVSSSYFIVKYNNKIMVTGNSHYGMMEEKAAMNANIPIVDARKIRQWYFKLCPEIPEWHRKIANGIKTKGYLENIFGAQGWFLNKDCPTILNQAIAWIPQSTIAVLVNKGLVNIEQKEKDIQVLLQVHDALAGQFKDEDKTAPERIIKHMSIELPYKKPLIIPVDISYDKRSYGHCR